MSKFGQIPAAGARGASLAYGVPQVLQLAGMLPTPLDRFPIFAPSLLLAPTFTGALRVTLILNGLLATPIFLQLFWARADLAGGAVAGAFSGAHAFAGATIPWR